MAKPAAGTSLNTGHAHAANLISCLPMLEGSGAITDLITGFTYSTDAAVTWVTSDAAYDPMLRGNGAGSISDAHATPLSGRSGPWAILLAVKVASLTQTNTYVHTQSGGGEQIGLIWEFNNNTLEFFATGFGGTDPRTGSGIVISDTTNTHVVGYSFTGSPGTWTKWLDGTPTTIANSIDVPISFTLPAGLTTSWWYAAGGANFIAADLGFAYQWSSVPDIAAVSLNPFAMFGAAAASGPASIYQLFEA